MIPNDGIASTMPVQQISIYNYSLDVIFDGFDVSCSIFNIEISLSLIRPVQGTHYQSNVRTSKLYQRTSPVPPRIIPQAILDSIIKNVDDFAYSINKSSICTGWLRSR